MDEVDDSKGAIANLKIMSKCSITSYAKKSIAEHSIEKHLEDDFPRKCRKVVSDDRKWTTKVSAVPTTKQARAAIPAAQKALQITCDGDTNFAAEVLRSIADSASLISNAFQEDASSTSDKTVLSVRNWV